MQYGWMMMGKCTVQYINSSLSQTAMQYLFMQVSIINQMGKFSLLSDLWTIMTNNGGKMYSTENQIMNQMYFYLLGQ